MTIQQIDWLKSSLTDLGQEYLEVFYEEIASEDREKVLTSICSFLGVKNWDFKLSEVKLKQQNPFSLREMLKNYDRVSSALSGTEAEWMLTDGE